MQNKKYDFSISILRVIAMLFIINCHILSKTGHIVLSQIFNVGVQMFFVISGYLCGELDSSDINPQWLRRRLVRLYLPLIAWIIIRTLVGIFSNNLPTWYQYIFLLFNIQGINFILTRIQDIFVGPWFFTSIMLCYFVFALYKKLEGSDEKLERKVFFSGGIFCYIAFVGLAVLGVSIDGLILFFIGYILKKRQYLEKRRKYNIFVSLGIIIISCITRLISRYFIDGSIIYDEVIVPTTHSLLAVSSLLLIKWGQYEFPQIIDKIGRSKVIRFLDKTSIYTYVIHDWLIDSFLLESELNIAIALPLYFVAVFSASYVAYMLINPLGRFINER